MTSPRKSHFLNELRKHYQAIITGAQRAELSAAQAAAAIHAEARKSEDATGAAGEARLAAGHRRRREQAQAELEALLAFEHKGVPNFGPKSAADLGALLDVSIEGSGGTEERTVFLLPVGAGTELQGPGGDGFLSVITPNSPVGRALRGARIGDSVEVEIQSKSSEWTVLDML
jgi:transcription elongation GreA/GreB family factor